jgi:DNA-binding MarR family transcriptional regulator
MPIDETGGAENDAVDRAAAEWADAWPELDVSPAEVLARIHRLGRLLDEAQARQLRRIPGWPIDNLGDFELLRTLRRTGEPYARTPRQLERDMLVSSAGISGRLKRLESAGWIQRVPSTADRRSVVVQLSPEGLKRLDSYLPEHYAFEAGLLEDLGDRRPELVRALKHLMAQMEPA